MNEIEARQELVKATEFYIELAKEVYKRDFDMPIVKMDLHGCVAGKASHIEWRVSYNYDIFCRNREDFLKRTVPHEVAHLITKEINSGNFHLPRHHGFEWRNVMRKFGVKDVSRCHNYDTEGIARRHPHPYIYACNCMEYKLTSNLHNKILAGHYRYCRLCKAILVFVRVEN